MIVACVTPYLIMPVIFLLPVVRCSVKHAVLVALIRLMNYK